MPRTIAQNLATTRTIVQNIAQHDKVRSGGINGSSKKGTSITCRKK